MNNLKELLCMTVKFTPEEIENILERFKKITVSKNAVLLKENEVSNSLWFINNGCAALKCKLNGAERILQVFKENSFMIDVYSYMQHKPEDIIMQALNDCELMVLSKEYVDELQTTMPRWKEFMQCLIKDACLFYALELLTLKSSSIEKRYFKLQNEQPELFQQLPLRTIANYLGITAVGLSKMRGRMQRIRYISS